jgi:hypothetical protein
MLVLGKAIEGNLSRKEVLNKIREEDLFLFYLGSKAKPGNNVSSPFHKDDNPSLSIYRARLHDKILWKDQSTGHFGDIFDMVALLHGTDLYGALIRINIDFDLGFLIPNTYQATKPVRKESAAKRSTEGTAQISIKAYKWSESSLWYWKQYGISESLLKVYNVFPAQRVSLNERIYWEWKVNNPIYGYLFQKDKIFTWKIYRPLASKIEGKWISNTNPSILQGWDQLPKQGKRLIITKSLKDVMVLRTLGEFSIAMQQEISTIKPSVMEELRQRFTEIYILQDLEYAGVKGSNKTRKLYPFVIPFFIQWPTNRKHTSIGKSAGFKDISDYRKSHSLEETKTHLYNNMNLWRKYILQE